MKKFIFTFAILAMFQIAPALAASSSTKPTPTPAPSPSPSPSPAPAAPGTGPADDQSFLDKYPLLKKNIYTEPSSNLYLGFSMGVLGVVRDRMFFTANFFQIHYMTSYWDNELLSISYGTTTANPSYVQSNHFVFRTMPMYRISRFLSVGVLGGYEYVSFPQISAVLYDGIYETKTEPFSSSGVIYGFGASQNFESESAYKIKINEVVYKETYSTQDAGKGWSYLYDSQALRADTTPIKAGVVMMIEVGMIF